MDESHFWGRVKTLIKGKGLTQEKTAEICGVPFATFRGWMAKDYLPYTELCLRLARALDVSIEYLLTGKCADTIAQIKEIRALLDQINKRLDALQFGT
jgi:transcriptional regulator with XRE-family HTH domain